MSTIKGRLMLLANNYGLSIRAFEDKCGLNRGNISNMGDNSSIGSDKLSKIFDTFPEVNPLWLISGIGDILKTNRSLQEQTRTKNSDSEAQSGFKVNKKIHPAQEYPLETRPRIPLEAAAGTLSIATESVTMEQCEQMPVIAGIPNYDFTIMVKGNSMEPDFKSGDEVACRFVRESSFIQWGQPHVVDSYDGIVLKRIHDNGDYIICSSDNPNYGDFQIPKTEIHRLALVVGLIRLY